MSRKPQYTRTLTDDTMLAVLQGNNQDAYPIRYGDLKAAIVGTSMKVGSFVYANANPSPGETAATQTITFSGAALTSNLAIAAFILPSNVNYDPATVVITVSGMTVDMIGDNVGATVGYIVAVKTT